jgi:hypothetical protein
VTCKGGMHEVLAVFPALCPIIGCIIRVFRRLACQSVTSHRLDTTHPCTCTTFCFEAPSLSWLLFHSIASFLFLFDHVKHGDHGGWLPNSRRHPRSTSQPPQWFAAATNLHQRTTSLSSSSLKPSTTGKCVEIITAHARRATPISRKDGFSIPTPLHKVWPWP